jgi:hypothetical protein
MIKIDGNILDVKIARLARNAFAKNAVRLQIGGRQAFTTFPPCSLT